MSKDEFIDWSYEILQNKYVLIKKLGAGSFCSVWLSYNAENDSYCAIKIINSDDYDYGIEEQYILEKLRDMKIPNTIKLLDSFETTRDDNVHVCLVLNYVGYTLSNILDDLDDRKEKLDSSTVETFKNKIYETLTMLHKCSILHGDIKPSNILVDYPNMETNKLIDHMKTDKSKSKIFETKKQLLGKYGTKIRPSVNAKSYSLTVKEYIESNSKKSKNRKTSSDYSEYYSDDDDRFRYSRDIVSCDSSSSTEEEQKDKSKNSDIKFDTNILKKSNIYISDFSSSKFIQIGERLTNYNIQTQYYMSPLVLLNIPYDFSIDWWSYYCILYEMKTNDILFYTEDIPEYISENRFHIQSLVNIFGKNIANNTFLNKSKIKDIYFKNNSCDLKYNYNKYITESYDTGDATISEIIENLKKILIEDERKLGTHSN